jgi:hypothetical protein
MLALVLKASKKLSQSGGGTSRHKVLPLGSFISNLEGDGKKPFLHVLHRTDNYIVFTLKMY